jgi:hypothetical protein
LSDLSNAGRVQRSTLSAVITRADGTVEDLGVIGYWNRNPLYRLAYRIRRTLGFC